MKTIPLKITLLFFLFCAALASMFAQPTLNDPCTSLSDYNSILLDLNPIQKRDFNEGWNMFGFPCQQSRSVSETFAEIESDLYIVKNNEGNFYWPEFDFDGIGNLIPLEGYQTKLYNPISDFRFCTSSINLPDVNIIGCSDCDACNFSPFATSSDELNMEICTYPSLGYDCYGNQIEILIGQKAYEYDGFVFYYDSINDKGLIAANRPLEEGSSDPYLWGHDGYEYGCYNYYALPVIDNPFYYSYIGRGKQNTIDIINANCETDFGGISAAEVASNYSYGNFYDWFLPSNQELEAVLELISDNEEYQKDYWSSTEYQYNQIYAYTGSINSQGEVSILGVSEKRYTYGVFPIHTFGNWSEGCMNNFALNYNENADIDDGSCVYPIYGCTDEAACNYNNEAEMNDGSCEYAQEGYDCEGNIVPQYQVGDYAEGGIVFYVDESAQHGLIAALENLPGTYEWGCWGTPTGANGQDIGTGYQNTMDIVNAGCETENGGVTAAQAALDADINGYNDWFLPSKDELLEMYNTIGDGGLDGDIGGFEGNWYWSSSELMVYYNDIFDETFPWNDAYFVNFLNGIPWDTYKGNTGSVRPIRSF